MKYNEDFEQATFGRDIQGVTKWALQNLVEDEQREIFSKDGLEI